ncbi:DUF7857 domain-containing protein [Halovenus marina]|uniref:DUF7857 domain-containing protein n=1 Tax=Halovenus marina TaxID=3396621 RepID=UPI003F5645E8
MASLDWECRRADGVTLVELLVTSDTAERVCIESTIEPVWPPRSQGRPTEGWGENSFDGTVSDESALAVGYASPADPADPPAVIAETTSVSAGTAKASSDSDTNRTSPKGRLNGSHDRAEDVTARALARTLGESGPPRDAVPLPSDESGHARSQDHTHETESTRHTTDRDAGPNTPRQTEHVDGECPALSWFDAVERRLDRAERLAAAGTVQEAQEVVEAAGGLDAVRALAAEIQADRRALDQIDQRHRAVSDRIDRVEIPIDALERLT